MRRVMFAVAIAVTTSVAALEMAKAAPIAPLPSGVATKNIVQVYYWHGRYYPYHWHGHYYYHRAYHYGHWRYW